jgi:uncharacterized protein YndB with AHSA1/START domain
VAEDSPLLIVRRIIAVPRERVFDAWLDPTRLAAFMRPTAESRATADVDPRVGGRFRIVMSHRGSAASVEHTGEYLLIERPARLVFTWQSINTDDRPTEVTIEFQEHALGTEVVLTHRRLPLRTSDSHRKGWSAILARLEEELR